MHMLLRSLYIFMMVLLHRPKFLIVNSGVANWLALAPIKLFGVKIIASLHNSLWPEDFYPHKRLSRALLALDALFFRSVADAVLCVSETCVRQVMTLSGIGRQKLFRHIPQFSEADFPPYPSHRQFSVRPFTIVFAGRIEANKGVFDILKIAADLQRRGYTDVRFVLCGDGSVFDVLQARIAEEGLDSHIVLKGKLDRLELLVEYRAAHIAIVPTRSSFAEGFAMVALEAALLGRPVLTNPVVPAHEDLVGAVMLAETNNPASYSDRIVELIKSPNIYHNLCSGCHGIRERYFTSSQGMDFFLMKIFSES
jgi:glycosyltransferase involved in cell wall biosynthesis